MCLCIVPFGLIVMVAMLFNYAQQAMVSGGGSGIMSVILSMIAVVLGLGLFMVMFLAVVIGKGSLARLGRE
jgi:hypothetical protein